MTSSNHAQKPKARNLVRVDFTGVGSTEPQADSFDRVVKACKIRQDQKKNLRFIECYQGDWLIGIPEEWRDEKLVRSLRAALEDAIDRCRCFSRNLDFRFERRESEKPAQDNARPVIHLEMGRAVTSITPEPFIDPYLLCSALNILVGDPGVGKSIFVLWVLALVSQGRKVFGDIEPAFRCDTPYDGTHVDMIWLSNEDDPETSKARYVKFGGDEDKIAFERFDGKTFALANLDSVEDMIQTHRPKILVIDSLMSHVGGRADVYRPNEMSSVLTPLQALASKYHIVVIVLMHMNKQDAAKAIYRVAGSIAIVGTSRCALYMDFKPDDEDKIGRIICHIKSNYTVHGRSQEIGIHRGFSDDQKRLSLPIVSYVGESELTAEDLLNKPKDDGAGGKKLEEAKSYILDRMVDGPQPATEMILGAVEFKPEPISLKTLERAKKALGIESKRSTDGTHSVWYKRAKKTGRTSDDVL
jgi:RecA-family ATPase